MHNISSSELSLYEKSAVSAVRALEIVRSRLEGEKILADYLAKNNSIGKETAVEPIFRVCDIVFAALAGYCGSEEHLAKDAHLTSADYFSLLNFYIKRAEITPNLIRAHQQQIGHVAIKNGRIDVIELLAAAATAADTGAVVASTAPDAAVYSCTITQMCGYDINSIRIVARKSPDMQRFLYQRAFFEMEAVESATAATPAATPAALPTGINALRFMQNLESFEKFKACVIADFNAINSSDAQKARESALSASNEADEVYKKFELYAKEQKSATADYSVVEAINVSLASVVENAALACQHAVEASILCERVVAAATASAASIAVARAVFDNATAALYNAHKAATYSELVNQTVSEYIPHN